MQLKILYQSGISEHIKAVVCIPTFRRPQQLIRTLSSLIRQQNSLAFSIVIADNDASTLEGAGVARAFFEEHELSGIIVSVADQGNCQAINGAFATALAQYPDSDLFLMLDDDEWADDDWLALMIGAQSKSGADIVGGPVFPVFSDSRKAFLSSHPAFSPYFKITGPVPIIYGSGNCLITRHAFNCLGSPPFDVRFNFLGGGDTDFFTRCKKNHLTFYWVNEARIYEQVPAGRTQANWIIARALRSGAINYTIEKKSCNSFIDTIKLQAKTAAIIPLSFWRALRLLILGKHWLFWTYPPLIGLGRILTQLGIEPQQYRASDSKSLS